MYFYYKLNLLFYLNDISHNILDMTSKTFKMECMVGKNFCNKLPMKKLIYKVFTKENGIKMNMEVLDHISNKLTDVNSINNFLIAYKSKYTGQTLQLSQVDELLKTKRSEKAFYQVVNFNFKRRNMSTVLEQFKKRESGEITRISLLETKISEKIFGVFYLNKMNEPVLEDEHDVIRLNFDTCKNNGFLHNNIFVGLKGYKHKNLFSVEEICLPEPIYKTHTNKFLDTKNIKICIINECDNFEDKIDEIYKNHTPNLFLSSFRSEHNLPNFPTHVILCKKTNNNILPVKIDKESIKTNANISSNPCLIETHNKQILFIDFDMIKYRETGLFCNDEPFDEFWKTFLSQTSANPFIKMDLSLDSVPNYIVIANDTRAYVKKIYNTVIVSLPDLKRNKYAIIDIEKDQAEIYFD